MSSQKLIDFFNEWRCKHTGFKISQILLVISVLITIVVPVQIFNSEEKYWNEFSQLIFSIALAAESIFFGLITNKEKIQKQVNERWTELIIYECEILKQRKSKIILKQKYQQEFCNTILEMVKDNKELYTYVKQGCEGTINCMKCFEIEVDNTLKVLARFGKKNCDGDTCDLINEIMQTNTNNCHVIES
jgi:hypothetical protein